MNDKIKPHHLERKAILYIRQSSAYQVNHNLESQKLQYAMQERLLQLGWREIEVVDEDLGRSAAGTVTRLGFERMVAEAKTMDSQTRSVCDFHMTPDGLGRPPKVTPLRLNDSLIEISMLGPG